MEKRLNLHIDETGNRRLSEGYDAVSIFVFGRDCTEVNCRSFAQLKTRRWHTP